MDQRLDPWGDPLSGYETPFSPPSWDAPAILNLFRKRYRRTLGGYGAPDTKTNARVKIYMDKLVLQVSNDFIFPTGRWEDMKHQKKREYDVPPKGKAADPERSAEESRRRAKSKVRDIALCNRFTHMLTWTLDPKKVDRYDPEQVYKKIRPFLSNMTQRKDFRYVVIPEYHRLKPGEEKPGIHFHGLCSLGSVRIERSMKRKRPRVDKHGRPVYNMTDWDLGWSTVVPLDGDYEKAVNYITKYISKQDTKILGKYYLSSRSLKKAPDIVPIDMGIDYETFVNLDKLKSGEQYETTIFRDVKVVSEDIEKGGIWSEEGQP